MSFQDCGFYLGHPFAHPQSLIESAAMLQVAPGGQELHVSSKEPVRTQVQGQGLPQLSLEMTAAPKDTLTVAL